MADGRTVRARDFVASAIDVHQTFEGLIDRSQLPAALVEKLDRFEGTPWTIFGVHLALDQPPMFDAASHDANINRALKWSVGAETLEDLFSGFGDVSQGRIPASIQFGAGPISGIDPSQAPPGKHTAYAWHVMPYDAEENAVDRARFREDFADEMMRTWTRYCPNMTSRNVLDRHVYTAHDYTREFVNMRDGDIFMGAFNAAQTMDNHFGYRPPVPGLYMAGSACHPGGAISGGAGYICAGLIAADLGITPWWAPVNARDAHERFAAD